MAQQEQISFNLNNPDDFQHKLIYLYHMSEYHGCYELSEQFLKKYPTKIEVKILNAMVKIQLGQFDNVENIFIDYLAQPEKLSRLDILSGLMLYYANIKSAPNATTYADQLLFEIKEQAAQVYFLKAKIAEKNQDLPSAVLHYQQSLVIKSNNEIKKHLAKIHPSNELLLELPVTSPEVNHETPEKLQFDITDKAQCIDTLLKISMKLDATSYLHITEKILETKPDDLEYQCLHALARLKHKKLDNIETPLLEYLKNPSKIDRINVIYSLILYYIHIDNSDVALKYIKSFIDKLQHYLAQAFFVLGHFLQKNQQENKALDYLTRSITIYPSKATFVMLASSYRFQCRLQEALNWCQKGLELYPHDDVLMIEYAYALKYVCDWRGEHLMQHELLQSSYNAITNGALPCISPFFGIITIEDSEINYKIAKQYASTLQQTTEKNHAGFSFQKHHKQKIRIGFVGMSFKDHPVGRMTAQMYQYYDRGKFDIYCYSLTLTDNSIYYKMIKNNCSQFHDVDSLSSIEIARLINQDEIDILIDLDCYLGNNRMDIFTYRPAPIQINYLGYPGTSGGNFMDYIIADEFIIPTEQQKYYSEKIIYMPQCYQMYGNNTELSLSDVSKDDFGLPKDKFIFSCFNMPHKIDKKSFDCWMKILASAPNSVLWLFKLGDNPLIEKNLRMHAVDNGIDPDRLIFGDFAPKNIHLSRIKLVDLMLDTFICNAHSTATDALWGYVPVITVQGKHFASRVCSSLLNYVGLPDFITYTEQQYFDKAIKIANNPKLLKKPKKILAKNIMSTLCNTALTVKNLERGYELVYRRYLEDKKPDTIYIPKCRE